MSQNPTQPKPANPDPATAGGDRRPSSCSAESLFRVMGEAASAHLTAKKAAGFCEMGVGWQISGFVLYKPETHERCIVEMSACRWLTNKEMWWLMHDSAQHDRQLLPNA